MININWNNFWEEKKRRFADLKAFYTQHIGINLLMICMSRWDYMKLTKHEDWPSFEKKVWLNFYLSLIFDWSKYRFRCLSLHMGLQLCIKFIILVKLKLCPTSRVRNWRLEHSKVATDNIRYLFTSASIYKTLVCFITLHNIILIHA